MWIHTVINLFQSLTDDYGVVYSGGYRFFEDTNKTIEVETNNSMKSGWILEELLREPFFIYPISPLIKKECFENTFYEIQKKFFDKNKIREYTDKFKPKQIKNRIRIGNR